MAGYFGKIPQRGDFVGASLGREFLDVWDQWLQDAVACSRDQLGDAWLDRYLTAPIWRFALCEGICGPSGWVGVLIPSVDRVGRYFPLTLAAPLPAGANPMQFACQAGEWFAEAESLVLEPLADEAPDPEDFASRVKALDAPMLDAGEAPTPLTPLVADEAMCIETVSDEMRLLSHQSVLTGGLLAGLLLRYSLWWTEGSECVRPNLLVVKHLPPVERFAAMLNGEWTLYGWSGYMPLSVAPDTLSREA